VFPADPIEFLFGLERLGMKFGLDNMRALCAALDHPERTFRSIHVAGTNGKGSVSAMVATALGAAGYRTGLYTSPHLLRLEERFVIAGREVARDALAASAARVKAAVETLLREGRLDAPATFFECTTAVAFVLFREARVDAAVLEVGLGGRLDATNVVVPEVAAITSIGFDHQAQLGDSLASIAREKAGIAKPGVPIVCGAVPEEARREIRAVAEAAGSPVLMAPDVVRLSPVGEGDPPTVQVRSARRDLPEVTLGLRGPHQLGNAAVAVGILDVLSDRGWRIPDAAVAAGLHDVRWPARLERFRYRSADVLLDAAHNPAGAAALASYLAAAGWRDISLVIGVMHDKDVRGILAPLLPHAAHLICTTPPSTRALPAPALAEVAREIAPSLHVHVVEDPASALDEAARLGRLVVVAGSIFLAGPVRDILR
jgi:dihydrofolate synthase/folylpolyglutamate synthase